MRNQRNIESKFAAHCAAERELAKEHLAACESPLERVFVHSLYRARKAASEAISESFLEVMNEDEVPS